MRGETNIRIVDLNPPTSKDLDHPSVSFVKTDITSVQSVRDALSAPFPNIGSVLVLSPQGSYRVKLTLTELLRP